MDTPKLKIRTRKVIDYAAMDGNESDDSEDDFTNRVTRIPTSSASLKSQKPSKLSKLKLGGRKKETSSRDCSPISTKHSQPTSGFEVIENIIDLSVAEPDLTAHSICSQETVLISSCECPSSQEFTDISDCPSPAGSTANLLAMEEMFRSTGTSVIDGINHEALKEITDRVTKKRMIDETVFSTNVKKTKIEVEKHEEQNLFLKTESPLKTADIHLLPPVVSPCVVVTSKFPEKVASEFQHVTPSKVDQENKEGYASEHSFILPESNPVRKTTTVMKTQPEITSQSMPKDTKKETKEKRKRLLQSKKPVDFVEPIDTGKKVVTNDRKEKATGKLKRARTPKLEVEESTKPVSAIKIDVEPHRKVDKTSATVESPKRDSVSSDLNNFKSPTSPPPIAKKLATTKTPTWNPPGKASSSAMTSTGNPPAIGLRLGLSRKRLAKPLHPDVKVKI